MRLLHSLQSGWVTVTAFEPCDFTPEERERSLGFIEDFEWKAIDGIPVGVKRPRKPQQEVGSGADAEGESPVRESEIEARRILEEARQEAEEIKQAAREIGRSIGYEEGVSIGKAEAYGEARNQTQEKLKEYLEEIRAVVGSLEAERDRLVEDRSNELRDLAIAVAEKVIRISLKSSEPVIEKMIAAATERVTSKSWAKISISGQDAQLMIESGRDVAALLEGVSERVQVEILEDAEQGTLVIELPDQIMDLSVGTQLENIRDILS